MFDNSFLNNVQQVLSGVILKKQANLIWLVAVKALLSELWFKQNQQVFHEKSST